MKPMFLTAGLLGAVFSIGLQAQVLDARAEVPFDFWVGQKLMPAGQYSIYHMASGVVLIRGQEYTDAAAVFLGSSLTRSERQTDGKLEFNRYGDTYFLSKIWGPDQPNGYGVPKTSREKELTSKNSPSKSTGIALFRK
ncbi:MAG TPA: hypothetical protein VKX49_31890 [Bryobacteraceae bacterium]|nr:hypothetical protein [Bryobacteraceae bacterium]